MMNNFWKAFTRGFYKAFDFSASTSRNKLYSKEAKITDNVYGYIRSAFEKVRNNEK